MFSGVGFTVLAVGCWLVKRILTRTSATSPINSVTQAPVINVAPVFNLPHTTPEKPKNESSAASAARPDVEGQDGRPVLRSLPPRICLVTESEDGYGFIEGGDSLKAVIATFRMYKLIDNFCQLKNRETLSRLWVLLGGYAEEADDVYKLRYQKMLA